MTQRWPKRMCAMLAALCMFFCSIDFSAFSDPMDSLTVTCGLEEHQHTDDCYETIPVCGLDETEDGAGKQFHSTFQVHKHDDSCYDGAGNLVCGIAEDAYYHIHNEFCLDEEGNVVCGLKEKKPHVHTDDCYQTEQVLVCDEPERAGHVHTDDCYAEGTELTCGLEADPGHQHSDECYQDTEVQVCELEENEEHTHGPECFVKLHELVCGEEEREGHTHTDACYTTQKELTCGQPEDPGHTHGDGCYETRKTLDCDELTTTHHHTDACRNAEGVLICGQTEVPTFVCTEENWATASHVHTDECYGKRLVCGKEGHTHTEACYDPEGAKQTATDGETTGNETAIEVEGATEETKTGEEADANKTVEGTGTETTTGDEDAEETSGELEAELPTFEIEEDVLTAYHGKDENVIVPDGIREIGRNAFAGNVTLRTVILPDSVELINNYAFADCTNLEQVILGEESRLAVIGNKAFRNDTKLDLSFAKRVESIYGDAFEEIPDEDAEDEQDKDEKDGNEQSENELTDGKAADSQDGDNLSEDDQGTDNQVEDDLTDGESEDEYKEEPTEIAIFTGEDAPVQVFINFMSDAGIPEGAELVVSEAGDGEKQFSEEQPAETKGLRKGALMKSGGLRTASTETKMETPRAEVPSLTVWNAGDEDPEIVLYHKTLDICLMADGKEIEPENPDARITVSVVLPGIEDGQNVEVRHITDEGAEVLESTNDAGTVTFVTNGFSLFEFTSRAQVLSSQANEWTENAFYGRTANQEAAAEAISLSEVTEGLEILEARCMTQNSDLWMTLRRTQETELGELESVDLYAVDGEQLGGMIRENISTAEVLRFTTADLYGYALVKDTGLRHRTEDLEHVTLDGMMPKNATAEATDVSVNYADFREYEETIAAYDISIYNNGGEYQPGDQPITVSIRDEAIAEAKDEGRRISLWHVHDDGTREEIRNFTVREDTLAFSSESFSVYIVTQETHLRTYRFYTLDEYQDYVDYILYDDQGKDITTQTIKNGEKPVAPQNPVNPQDPNATFAGWYLNTTGEDGNVVLSSEPYDFDNIPEITADELVKLYAKFITSAYVVFHGQYDRETNSFPVVYTRRADVTRHIGQTEGSAQVRIDDLSVPFEGFDDNHPANSMVFSGWSEASVKTPGAALNDNGTPVQAVTADEITIKEGQTIHLYPIFTDVYWLSYDSGPTGSGATYYPEAYYFNGEGPNTLADHLPTRDMDSDTYHTYTFEGWYTGADGTGTQITNANGSLVDGAADTGISVNNGRIQLTANVMLHAKWTEHDTASYTIVIVKQKASDTDGLPNAAKSYEYSESFLLQGTIDSTVSAGTDYIQLDHDESYNRLHEGPDVSGAKNPYFGYTYNAANSDSTKTVSGKGDTIIYVRYDWTTRPSEPGSFTLTFSDSAEASGMSSSSLPITRTVAYGTALAGQAPSDPEAGNSEQYTFTGWYTNKECATRVFFENNKEYQDYTGSKVLFETMPGANFTVYAGWEENWYIVTIDPNYGAMYEYSGDSLVGTGSTWFWSAYGGQIQEYSTVTRKFVESDSGTWYYVNHSRANGWTGKERKTYYTEDPSEATEFNTFEEDPDVYRYAGWYEVKPDGSEEPYDFSRIVEYDITLKLHWTKTGVFYLEYDPGIGTLYKNEENEKLYVELDGNTYNDDADVVITRTAVAPTGYEFVGWTIRTDDSEKIYRPGETFRLLSADAATVQGKRRIYLDAVYTRVPTATIVYHANGGVATTDEANVDPGSPAPEVVYNSEERTLTVSKLVNNSSVKLSDGAWLSMTNATFAGWCSNPVYDPNDDSAPLLDPARTDLNVDTNESVDLYAIWQVDVKFHLNKDISKASLGDWGEGYSLNAAGDTYTQVVYLGNVVSRPAKIPTCTDSALMFREWRTVAYADHWAPDESTIYPFSEPITGELDLYAYWTTTLDLTVKALDATNATITDQTAWVTEPHIRLDGTRITLDESTADSYVDVPDGYQFAFAAAHDADTSTSVSEHDAITSLWYNTAARKAYVTYADGTKASLDGKAVCFVYYQKQTLVIKYETMATNGVLTSIDTLDAAAPTRAENLGQYNLTEQISRPLTWSHLTNYGYYSYALGSEDAYDASRLMLITQASVSESDGQRPNLIFENTWRGFRYSEDGGSTWTNCGYDTQAIHVVYYDRHATIVTFDEKTLGYTDDLSKEFKYDYTIYDVNRNTGEEQFVYGPGSDDYQKIPLHSGGTYSAILFTDSTTTQKVKVEQTPEEGFDTSVKTAQGTSATCVYTHTADGTGTKQEATFINTRTAELIEVHAVRVNVNTGKLLLQDNWITGARSFEIKPGEEKAFRSVLPGSSLVTGQTDYDFGAIFIGTDSGSDEQPVIPVSSLTVETIAFEQVDENDGSYKVYLKDADGKRLGELGTYRIYYLYYPSLTVYYMQEGDNGVLTQVQGTDGQGHVVDAITYGGAPLTINGEPVVQGQKTRMPQEGLTITQNVGNGCFNMPPLLDNKLLMHELIYSKLAAIPQDDSTTVQTNMSAFSVPGAGISEDLNLYMKVIDQKLQWSFDGTQWTEISKWPVVYAIYRERGYELDITKTVPIDTGNREPFTITITSTAINREKYKVEGTGYTEIKAIISEGCGTITFPVTDGSIVKLFGLGPGDYTITESENENYILTATTGTDTKTDIAVADNSTVSLTLDDNRTLNLVNNSKRICRIGHEYFYSLSSAIQYIEDYSANFTETIEMLIDYKMPASDSTTIPSFCNITLTTAASDPYKTCGNTAVITRSDTFTNGAMINNVGTFTLGNVILDGGHVSTGSPMIDNKRTLNISNGSVLRNANCTKEGGAVYSWEGLVNVDGGTICGCKASQGGAIYATSKSVVEMNSGTLNGNNATLGGAIYYEGDETVTVNGGTVRGNEATNGGAIYMASGAALITGGLLQDNHATEGGAVYALNAYVTVNGGEIAANAAGKNGGAVYMKTLTLTVNGGSIIENTAGKNGGAIWAGTGSVDLFGGNLKKNSSPTGNGGAVYSEYSAVTVDGSTIGGSDGNGNSALNGGGIYAAYSTVTLAGMDTVISHNSAVNDGGAVYSGSESISATNVGLTHNTAQSGNGGALYTRSGAMELTGCTMSDNSAINGAAVFIYEGAASVYAGIYTENTTSAGGAIGFGSDAAKLNLSGKVMITGNTMMDSETTTESNVYLDQDTDMIINAVALTNDAKIGIYVPGDMNDKLFLSRGLPSCSFGTFESSDNTTKVFKNDRTENMIVAVNTPGRKLYWIRNFEVKVYYTSSYESGLPYDGTNYAVEANYARTSIGTPPKPQNIISELADDIRSLGIISPDKNNDGKGDHDSTAIFGHAFFDDGEQQFSDYLTEVNWDSVNNLWQFNKRDGTTDEGGYTVGEYSTLIFFFTEPYYLTIENNTESTLTLSNLTVKGSGWAEELSVINDSNTIGYGYVFAVNDTIKESLKPVKLEDLELGRREAIKILLPGGKEFQYTLEGSFASTDADIPYSRTDMADDSIPAASAVAGFAVTGSISTKSGETHKVVFGGNKVICRIVHQEISNADPSKYETIFDGSGETEGSKEYTFSSLKQAITFINTYNLQDAKIEMVTDYLIPASDTIDLNVLNNNNNVDSVTISTAMTGTYQYPVTEENSRATISRNAGNSASFITSTGGNYSKTLKLTDLQFDGKNFSGNIDGGVVKTKNWNVYIDTVEFRNCKAGNGGGIFIESSSYKTPDGILTVKNSDFTSCESTSTANRAGGGAIWTNLKVFDLSDCNFVSCQAYDQAGAVFHRIDAYMEGSKATVSGCSFTDCSANAAGGLELDVSDITVTDCKFTRCNAKVRNGGGLNTWCNNSKDTTDPATVTVTDCEFDDCHADSTTQANYGGGLRSNAKDTTITNCTFKNCSSFYGGGIGISNTNASSAKINGCLIDKCSASSKGGGIFCSANEMIIDEEENGTTTYSSAITNCTAGVAGGGIYHNVDIDKDNKNHLGAGSLFSIAQCTLNACVANSREGGGIFTTANAVSIADSKIEHCTSEKQGGGIYIRTKDKGTATLSNTLINTCIASGNGGGLSLERTDSTLVIEKGSSITGNTSDGQGGGIYTTAQFVTLKDLSEVKNNKATGNGGGIYHNKNGAEGILTIIGPAASDDPNVAIEGTTVSDNISDSIGGGIYTLASMALEGTVIISGNRLTSDETANVAGVYLTNGRMLTIGKTGESEKTTKILLKDNLTVSGKRSDLRLPESNTVVDGKKINDNKVEVKCGVSGEIRVVNAHARTKQFGHAVEGSPNPPGFSDLSYVFIADDDSIYGIIDRSDSNGLKIIWAGDPICKITDASGKLLYLDNAQARPAVFDRLYGGAERTSAFGVLQAGDTDLYYANGLKYTGNTYQVKMLVEEYKASNCIKTTANSDRTIILTTAGSNDKIYPYQGRPGTRSTILRTSTADEPFINVKTNLTLQNVVLDGGSENGITEMANNRILFCETADTTIRLGRNATIQNTKVNAYGAGIRVNNATAELIVEGGSIRNCVSMTQSGGGIQVKSGNLTITAGTITKCKAAVNGGGILFETGTFTMSGGTISRCEAVDGGGVYMNTVNSKYPKMYMSGGTITGNSVTGKGGGIAVANANDRIYFSKAPYVYGNTSSSAKTDPSNPDQACNVQLDFGFNYNTNILAADNPGTVIVSQGLMRGATIGVYIPDTSSLYTKHGIVKKPFATYDGSTAGLNYFINDRNGMKGGLTEDERDGVTVKQADANKKIYWRIIYALSVSKQVLSDEAVDLEKEFRFKIELMGNTAGTPGSNVPSATGADGVNGWFGDEVYFVQGVAYVSLKNGETKTAELLPLGFEYRITEILDDKDAKRFMTTSLNDLNEEGTETAEGVMSTNTPTKYTYSVFFSNLSAVCKITDPVYGLLYRYNPNSFAYEPEVYSNLAKAFNKVNAGDSRDWFWFDGEDYHQIYPEHYKIEMLIPDYDMDYPESLASLISGKEVTLTTADPKADDGFPYTGTGAARIIRAVTGESMFTVIGHLILDNIELDGGSSRYTCDEDGGIVQVKNGGELTIGTGVSLENSTTQRNGAGIYLAEGSKLYISGNPHFSGNVINASSIASETNGGETSYAGGIARQDIYIAGYENENAISLVVTGNLTGTAGSIWVWAEDKPHYWQRKQFAVMKDGVKTGLNVFRNARTDLDTINNTNPMAALYGETKTGDAINVYWTGSPIVTVTKKLIYEGSSGELPFSFEATLYESDGTTAVSGRKISENLTTNQDGKVTFTIRAAHGATPKGTELFIPDGYQLKVEEISLPPPSIYQTTVDSVSGTSKQIKVTTDSSIAFINERIPSDEVVLAVSKRLAGNVEDEDKATSFPFVIDGVETGWNYVFDRYVLSSDGSTWLKVSSGEGRVGEDKQIAFNLKDGERIALLLPKNSVITVKETDFGEFRPSYSSSWSGTVHEGDTVAFNESAPLAKDVEIDFVNTMAPPIVPPTSFASNHAPFLILLTVGLILIFLARGRKEHASDQAEVRDTGRDERSFWLRTRYGKRARETISCSQDRLWTNGPPGRGDPGG